MKIVVKGVMTVDDALASVKHGVDGIWVSNHGARQLDTTPATIEVIPDFNLHATLNLPPLLEALLCNCVLPVPLNSDLVAPCPLLFPPPSRCSPTSAALSQVA